MTWFRNVGLQLGGQFTRVRGAVSAPYCDRYWNVDGRPLPAKLPSKAWVTAAALFVLTYVFMWSFVHVRIDQRPCTFALDDPLFEIIRYDGRWYWVTHQLYTFATLSVLSVFVATALLGDHRPLVLWGLALAFEAILRSITMLLVPLCRATVAVGSRALVGPPPSLDLGFITIPWRVWATNDLVFSGHVGEFVLVYLLTRQWPRAVRLGLIGFQCLQAYALIATRGHYTIDIVLAVPCALFEFRLALRTALMLASPLRSRSEQRPLPVELEDGEVLANGVQ